MDKVVRDLMRIANDLVKIAKSNFDDMDEETFINEASVLSQNVSDVNGFVKDVLNCKHSNNAKKKVLTYLVNYDPSSLEVMRDKSLARKAYNLVKTNINSSARDYLKDIF